MIPTDMMEAVERLRRNANGEWVVDIYDGNPDDARTAWTCDLVKLSDHCLPWLDPTPIDAAWIQSLGAVETASGTYWRLQSPVHSVYWLIRQNHLIVEMRDNTTRTVTATTNATRGQLLMLLTALGVTCKESNNG